MATPTHNVAAVPNQPKTPKTGWRIPLDLIEDIKWVARDNRETTTSTVIRALRREVRDHYMRSGRERPSDEN